MVSYFNKSITICQLLFPIFICFTMKKMKNKLVQSTLILMVGGLITKIMAMIIKIVLTRYLKTDGLSLYMMVMPTFNLFITLASFSTPISISKLVSENTHNNKKLVLSIVPFIIIFNTLLIGILIFIAPFLSEHLLHNKDTLYPLMAIGLTLPFISISAIIRGYLFGKEKMFPHTLGNNLEQVIRLLLIVWIVPHLIKYPLYVVVSFVILTNIFSELTSIITMIFFLPKNTRITKEDLKYDKSNLKDILNISIPTTGTRLIGSFTYFLEPIVLTYALLKNGYSSSYITLEYGIINGYVLPLIMLPSFFTNAISSALLPIISQQYVNKNFFYAYQKLKQACTYCLIVGIPVTIILCACPNFFLKVIYNTTSGSQYIRLIAPFFLLHYIQSPLTTTMQAIGLSKEAMQGTTQASILRIFLLFVLSFCRLGISSLFISIIANIIYVTVHHYIKIKKAFRSKILLKY